MNLTFITDRLAVGDITSRTTPGFVAVVSLLTHEELRAAPKIPGETYVRTGSMPARIIGRDPNVVSVLHVTVADGSTEPLDLDEITSFIATYLAEGCVLVHCGAGMSRSVAIVVAYLCRYAGMSYVEALSFVKERRPGAAPADCFADAVKRWLRLEDLSSSGPRHV